MRRALAIATLLLPAAAQASELLHLDVFGDVNASIDPRHTAEAGLSLGELVFNVTSTPSDHIQLLAELGVEADGPTTFAVDLERLQARFTYDDRLAITVGRIQQALGYYNPTYHRGALFQVAAERPDAVKFEEQGGLIPTQTVGFEVSGELPVRAARFGYALDVGNGRGRTQNEVLSAGDLNVAKSANVELYLWWPVLGLRFGVNGLHDTIPASDLPGAVHGAEPENLAGVHAVLDHGPLLVIAESYLVRHTVAPGVNADALGSFIEGSYAVGRLRPYLQLNDVQRPDVVDPFYAAGNTMPADLDSAIVGVDISINTYVALKAQVELEHQGEWQRNARLQLAFGF